MQTDQISTVLTEMLEEQKESTKLLTGIKDTCHSLEGQLELLSAKINALDDKQITVTMHALQSQLQEGFSNLISLVNFLPQPVIHQKRFLLFPEHNAREYYSVFRWILYCLIATYAYFLLKHLIDSI